MTYQQLLLPMCCSGELLHVFFYIKRVDMLDVEEFTYVSPEVQMNSVTSLHGDVEQYCRETIYIYQF